MPVRVHRLGIFLRLFICSSYLKNTFPGYRLLDWWVCLFLFFRCKYNSYPCFSICKVSFSLSLIFCGLKMIYIDVHFGCIYPALHSLSFLDLYFGIWYKLGGNSQSLLFPIFLPLISLFLLLPVFPLCVCYNFGGWTVWILCSFSLH